MITREEIQAVREKARGLKALVIGDAMLDQYIYGTVDRISPEAPVPIVSHKYTEIKAGGAANVALNLAAWGCQTSLIGMAGGDSNAKVLADLVERQHIRHHLYHSLNRPTTVKTRVVASSHHLLRIDEESTDYLAGEEETKVLDHIQAFLRSEKPDLIILEDYNKGLLTSEIIGSVIGYGQKNGVFIAVDPKEKNFFDYSGVNLFKPNLREAGQAARRHLDTGDLSKLCLEWLKRMSISTIAITLGAQGIFLQQESGGIHVLPERPIDVIDVCGAGDAVICSLALCSMSGLALPTCGSLANLTGAYVCSHSGVVSVEIEDIYQWI